MPSSARWDLRSWDLRSWDLCCSNNSARQQGRAGDRVRNHRACRWQRILRGSCLSESPSENPSQSHPVAIASRPSFEFRLLVSASAIGSVRQPRPSFLWYPLTRQCQRPHERLRPTALVCFLRSMSRFLDPEIVRPAMDFLSHSENRHLATKTMNQEEARSVRLRTSEAPNRQGVTA